jgi:hypothetical protein
MVDEKFNPLLIDDEPDTDSSALPERIAADQKRQAGIYDITRQLSNIQYSGSGLKQELVELENNMRELLSDGTYGYKYIEGFLISIGYNLNKIRQTFKRLTGIEPQVYLDAQPVLDTPGTIPGVNYGWGKSKDKKFDYYFVMPYKVGYSVFGQKGDLVREEISYVASLDEARDALKKKVADIQIYDEIVSIEKLAPKNNQYLSENFPFGTKTAEYEAIEKYFTIAGQNMQLLEKKAILEDALSTGKISEVEFRHLAEQSGIIRFAEPDIEKTNKEGDPDVARMTTKEVMEEEDKIDKNPIQEELDEQTHMQFFEKNKDKKTGGDVTESMRFIMEYLENVNEQLAQFTVNYRSLKYIAKDVLDRIEKTPRVGDDKAEEVLSSSGTVSVLLDIIDKTLPPEKNKKQGLLIFSIIGGEVLVNDVFKGEDNKPYALNETGFEKYFFADRQKMESK